MKNILVTGGAGFIGSNFIKHMLEKYSYNIVNIDMLTYAGTEDNLREVRDNSRYNFVKADIRDRDTIEKIFKKYSIDTVVNFAAESHVDRSIIDSTIFFSTNVIGTQVLLEEFRKHWEADSSMAGSYQFLQISTDEVYGSLEQGGLFSESTPLMPNNPYSASKASADLLVRSYFKTYGLPIKITRCSNNYGPHQYPEKLIPLVIHNCINDMKIPVYGNGIQIRDWIYVKDHCNAVDTVLHKGKFGEVYNIGGGTEIPNIDVVRYIIKLLGKSESLIQYVKDRPGHDRRYAMDFTKISTNLGWRPEYSFERGMQLTVEWYLNKISSASK